MTDELLTADQAIRPAMVVSGKTPDEVLTICRDLFKETKFSKLTDGQKWTLIATLNPEATGPYGCSMEPF